MSGPDYEAVVEWGDRSGGRGFSRYIGTEFAPASNDFVDAAKNLLAFPAVQPPSDWTWTPDSPVWGLVYTEVAGRGPRWCFIVQGLGRVFSGAGGCQFVFFDDRVGAAEAWWRGTSAVDRQGLVTPAGLSGPLRSQRADTEVVRVVLDSMLGAREVLAIDADSTAVAAAIGAALSVLPERVARQYIWFTRLLGSPRYLRKLVAGLWPSESGTRGVELHVNDWLRWAESQTNPLQHARHLDILQWSVDRAVSADGGYLPPDVDSVDELIDYVVATELPIADADIERLVDHLDPVLAAPRAQPALLHWSTRKPEAAIHAACRAQAQGPIGAALVEALLEVHAQAPDGTNPIGLPPASEPEPYWHMTLTRHLLRKYGKGAALREFVSEQLVSRGLLDSEETLVQAEVWLRGLGLEITDFRMPIGAIVEQLSTTGTIDQHLAAKIRDGGAGFATARKVITRLAEPISGAQAVTVLRLVDAGYHGDVIQLILARHPRVDSEWADVLIDGFPDSDEVIHALWQGLYEQQAVGSHRLLAAVFDMYARADRSYPDRVEAWRRATAALASPVAVPIAQPVLAADPSRGLRTAVSSGEAAGSSALAETAASATSEAPSSGALAPDASQQHADHLPIEPAWTGPTRGAIAKANLVRRKRSYGREERRSTVYLPLAGFIFLAAAIVLTLLYLSGRLG